MGVVVHGLTFPRILKETPHNFYPVEVVLYYRLATCELVLLDIKSAGRIMTAGVRT